MLFKDFSNFSFSGHFFSAMQNHFSNFGNGVMRNSEQAFEIILKSGHRPRRRCHLNIYLFLAVEAILFSRLELFDKS